MLEVLRAVLALCLFAGWTGVSYTWLLAVGRSLYECRCEAAADLRALLRYFSSSSSSTDAARSWRVVRAPLLLLLLYALWLLLLLTADEGV